MAELGYGDEYRYAHNEASAYAAGEAYLPAEVQDTTLYQPAEFGLEVKIEARMEFLKTLDQQASQKRYR